MAGISSSDILLICAALDRCFMAGMAYFLGGVRLSAAVVRGGAGSAAQHWELVRRTGATAIVGVPSLIHKIGEFALEQKENPAASNVQKLIAIGEPTRDKSLSLLPISRELETMWDAPVFSTYASSEMATTFCECEARVGGHVRPELIVVEILDDKSRSVPQGDAGEVVVTPLGVTGMPLIRFRTGDISHMETSQCPCGRTTPRLAPVSGRKNQMLKYKGTTIFPNAIISALEGDSRFQGGYVEARRNPAGTDRVILYAALEGDESKSRHPLLGSGQAQGSWSGLFLKSNVFPGKRPTTKSINFIKRENGLPFLISGNKGKTYMTAHKDIVILNGNDLSFKDIVAVGIGDKKVELDTKALKRCRASRDFLAAAVKDKKIIYGVNTSFGPMCNKIINQREIETLQTNLITSHAAGLGSPILPYIATGIMAIRLNTLVKGHSGVRVRLLAFMRDMINAGIAPYIPECGSVGASGDLIHLAHMSLAIIGKGKVYFKGELMPAPEAFEKTGLAPLTLSFKEGLALMNGTAAMTGIAAFTLFGASKLLNIACVNAAFAVEIFGGIDDAFDPDLHSVKPHPGQVAMAAAIKRLYRGTGNITRREDLAPSDPEPGKRGYTGF